MKSSLCLLGIIILSACLTGCEPEAPETKSTYLDLPAMSYSYGMGVDDAIPTLGRVLFYDKSLSINSSISCASCHKQILAFSDNVAFSRGFENRLTGRNSMPIQNLNNNFFNGTSLFWDGRERDLRQMVLKPIVNHVEMGINDLDKLASKLSEVPYYQELFTQAYGNSEITNEKLSNALSYFLMSISSTATKFDMVNAGAAKLSPLEAQGRSLFFEDYDCNSCHQVQNPSGYIQAGTFANIGLDVQYSDPGLEAVTKNAADAGRFKIPSLRNVGLTAPYMHDGRFESLDEVLDFYSEDIQENENLDFRLRSDQGTAMKFHIPENDRKALIAFLNTLTDTKMISDPKFSNPFKTR
jgi:cytochrome c peroxidase